MNITRILLLALFLIFSLTGAPEARAAEPSMEPPPEGFESRPCHDCHRLPNTNTNEGIIAANRLCMECHGQEACVRKTDRGEASLRVDLESFGPSRHRHVACLDCHFDVARSPHKSVQGVRCLACHHTHGETDFGAPHLSVRCEACHHKSEFVELDKERGVVSPARVDDKGEPLGLVDHGPSDYQEDELCLRCHMPENRVGAPAAVLPGKGAVCFLCHSAGLSTGGIWSGIALLVFFAGLLLMARLWLKGRVQGEGESLHRKIALGSEHLVQVLFSRESWSVFKVFFLDVILQRRILQESIRRWLVHTLIYWSILARLALGVFTWLVWQAGPGSDLAGALMDKDHGFTAFFHDLTGLLMLAGVLVSAIQRVLLKPVRAETASRDAGALVFIGLIALLGFLIEAVRIRLIGLPPGEGVYAFVGYPLSRVLSGPALDWNTVYVWLWYAHGIISALFVAWLPFGKMRHMFTAPLSLVMNRK